MKINDANALMQDLFAQYHTIFRHNGRKWIISENQKEAAGHLLSEIQPTVLKERHNSDLAFLTSQLPKGFKRISLARDRAYQRISVGYLRPTSRENWNR